MMMFETRDWRRETHWRDEQPDDSDLIGVQKLDSSGLNFDSLSYVYDMIEPVSSNLVFRDAYA